MKDNIKRKTALLKEAKIEIKKNNELLSQLRKDSEKLRIIEDGALKRLMRLYQIEEKARSL